MRKFIENECLKVEIDTFGAEVKSVMNKKNCREYMWYGNPKFWGRTSPVLFPFVGSLKDKKYTFEGKEYAMGQHGFARDNEFVVVSEADNEIWFLFESSEATKEKFPLDFKLFIGYQLEENQVKVLWRVENPMDSKLYFSIGAHPAFLCPVHGEGSKAGYKLFFGDKDQIRHHGNDVAKGLAIREDLVLSLTDGRVEITEDFFDRCTYMIEGNQTGIVGIEDPLGNRIVDVCFDTPLFAIWSPEKKNAPFICIEPWYGRCDALDFEGSLEEREFTNVLDAGEQFNGGYSMKFYD